MKLRVGDLYHVDRESFLGAALYLVFHSDPSDHEVITIHKIDGEAANPMIWYTSLLTGTSDFMRADLFRDIFIEANHEQK